MSVTSVIDQGAATAFLASGRIAVVGASDDPKNFGQSICKALIEHGIQTVAVHPEAPSSAGAPCYPSLTSVPGTIDGVIVVVPKQRSADVVSESIGRGIQRIWLFKGAGPGTVSEEALRLCEDHDVEVIAGACPLMFLGPVRGVHRVHRALRRANHSLTKAAVG